MKKKLLIIGAGGHGRVIASIAKISKKYKSICFLDDADIEFSGGYPVIDKIVNFKKYISEYVFFVAIGTNEFRQEISQKLLDSGAQIVNCIHPSAIINDDVVIGKGVAVIAGAVINTGATIGDGVIINTQSSVDHDSHVGSYSHIAVGAHIAGEVKIGKNVFVGAGAVVIEDIKICDGCTIGAGAVVVKNIEQKGTYTGMPAKLK